MFKKHFHRRSTNIVFVIFRLVLSMVMFGLLFGGVYQAYKHFSGLDPFKLDPQAVAKDLLGVRTPQQILTVLSSVKLSPKIAQPVSTPQVAFKFLLVSDSHNDNANLSKAISQAKTNYPVFVIGLGDYTNVGT